MPQTHRVGPRAAVGLAVLVALAGLPGLSHAASPAVPPTTAETAPPGATAAPTPFAATPASAAAPSRLAAAPLILRASGFDSHTRVPARSFAAPGGNQRFQAAATATATVSYSSNFNPSAQAAVQAAIDIWTGIVSSSVPMKIQATWDTTQSGNSLAGAGPPYLYADIPNGGPNLLPNTYYAPALAQAIMGTTIANRDPNEFDITIGVNANRTDWYFGTDGATPAGKYDLESVILHEITHGFGFLGTANVSGSRGSWGFTQDTPKMPDIYDRFVQTTDGTSVLNTSVYPNPSTALGTALRSPLYFSSTKTNRGIADRPRLYAPSTWSPGSSYSHLDETTYPNGSANSLTTPFLNSAESVHAPGPLTLCMLEALGWTTPEDCTPPAQTTVQGSTWYGDGTPSKAGATGSAVTAYGTGLKASASFRLVTGLDAGVNNPCMWDVQPVNPNVRVSNARGFVPYTSGTVSRATGAYQLCLREEASGNSIKVGGALPFTVS